jgi:hypothetical protein
MCIFNVLYPQPIVEALTEPTSQRHHVLVSHLHGCVHSQGAAKATAAVYHNFLPVIGDNLVQVEFKHSTRDVFCSLKMPGLVFTVLADVNYNKIWVDLLLCLQVFN